MADTRNNLGNPEITVSDYLRSKHLAATLYWGARSRSGEAYLGIDPDLRWIPDAEAGATIRPGGQQADISVGWEDRLRAKTGIRRSPFDSGMTAFEQLSSQLGPGEVFWERAQQEGSPDRKTDKFGGSLTLGGLRFSGEQLDRTIALPTPFPEIEQRQRRASVGGQYPVGSGILSGRVGREWMQQGGVDAAPRTSGEVGWTGKIGRVPLNASLRYARTRDQEPFVSGIISGRIPF